MESAFLLQPTRSYFLGEKMLPHSRKTLLVLNFCFLLTFALHAQDKPSARPRARDLGVPFDGTPDPFNAITAVSGVTVGPTTLISVQRKLHIRNPPPPTSTTPVLPPA